jgi:hypothetical protein
MMTSERRVEKVLAAPVVTKARQMVLLLLGEKAGMRAFLKNLEDLCIPDHSYPAELGLFSAQRL